MTRPVKRTVRIVAALGALVVAATAAVLLATAGGSANAETPPPWAPGGVSQDANAVGGIAFFDSSGNVITGGSITSPPFAAYAVGESLTRTETFTDTKATLLVFQAQPGQTPDEWSNNDSLAASTTYPVTTAPSPINSTTLPVVAGKASDLSLAAVATDFPSTASTTGYVDAYEVRMITSAPGHPAGSTYDYADITINPSTGLWALVYSPSGPFPPATTAPASPTTTTTSLSATPAGSALAGASVGLTATVSPSSAAGTVQFLDGATAIGSPVTVSGGTASASTSTLAAGSHTLTAKFTPTNSATFAASTSTSVSYTITSPATITSTSLAVAPTSPIVVGTSSTLTATVTPSTAVGSVQFKDGSTNLGAAVAVSGGSALKPVRTWQWAPIH